jgi:hypothetical protein
MDLFNGAGSALPSQALAGNRGPVDFRAGLDPPSGAAPVRPAPANLGPVDFLAGLDRQGAADLNAVAERLYVPVDVLHELQTIGMENGRPLTPAAMERIVQACTELARTRNMGLPDAFDEFFRTDPEWRLPAALAGRYVGRLTAAMTHASPARTE